MTAAADARARTVRDLPSTLLRAVLVYKILGTCALVAAFGLGPEVWLEDQTGVRADGPDLFRLYAVTMAALLLGYASGLWALSRGRYPWGIVFMGLVSNGLSAAVVLTGPYAARSPLLAFFVTSVTLGLAAAASARLVRDGPLVRARPEVGRDEGSKDPQ